MEADTKKLGDLAEDAELCQYIEETGEFMQLSVSLTFYSFNNFRIFQEKPLQPFI